MGQVIMNRINKKRLGKSENVSVHSTMLVEWTTSVCVLKANMCEFVKT
jgi:hypothetical protein